MNNEDMGARAARDLGTLREARPLVHNITNYVVMNTVANALLAAGASPVMAHAAEEVEEMVGLASALVLNIGTLSPPLVASMLKAGKAANRRGVPVVLDPVGAGATSLRTDTARELMDSLEITVLRANASEALALARAGSGTNGVDSVHGVEEAAGAARSLAASSGAAVVITGEQDLIIGSDGRGLHVLNGHWYMGLVTGTGCAASALAGAFLAVERDPVEASASALAFFGLAGEAAAAQASGPASFQVGLLDALYNMSEQDLEKGAGIRA